jgi:acyl carrier protein
LVEQSGILDEGRETQISETLASILEIETLGANDSFFDHGGNSLRAIQAIGRLQREIAPQIALVDLFECSTPRQLAARLSGREQPHSAASAVTESRYLLPYQYWYWAESRAAEAIFTLDLLLDVGEHVDEERLVRAVERLLARHDALRSHYLLGDTDVQVAVRQQDARGVLRHVDVRDAAPTLLDDLAVTLRSELSPPNGEVLRIGHIRRADKDSDLLLVVVHHLASDGYGLEVLAHDLEESYRNEWFDAESDPRPTPTSALWWSERIGRYVESEESAAERAYWESRPATEPLALLQPRPGARAGKSERIRDLLSPAGARELASKAAVMNATPNEFVTAAVAVAAARVAGQGVVVVGSNHFGRTIQFDGVGCARTVGWLTHNIPFVLDVQQTDGNEALAAVVSQVTAIPRAGIGNMLLSFDRRCEPASQRLDEIRRHLALNVNFIAALPLVPDTDYSWRESEIAVARPPAIPRGHRIRLMCVESEDGSLDLAWDFSDSHYEPVAVQSLATEFRAILDGA